MEAIMRTGSPTLAFGQMRSCAAAAIEPTRDDCVVAEAKAGAEATGVIKAIARTGDGALLHYA